MSPRLGPGDRGGVPERQQPDPLRRRGPRLPAPTTSRQHRDARARSRPGLPRQHGRRRARRASTASTTSTTRSSTTCSPCTCRPGSPAADARLHQRQRRPGQRAAAARRRRRQGRGRWPASAALRPRHLGARQPVLPTSTRTPTPPARSTASPRPLPPPPPPPPPPPKKNILMRRDQLCFFSAVADPRVPTKYTAVDAVRAPIAERTRRTRSARRHRRPRWARRRNKEPEHLLSAGQRHRGGPQRHGRRAHRRHGRARLPEPDATAAVPVSCPTSNLSPGRHPGQPRHRQGRPRRQGADPRRLAVGLRLFADLAGSYTPDRSLDLLPGVADPAARHPTGHDRRCSAATRTGYRDRGACR